eukprot:2077747-Rhodomonas_salina.6
MADTWSPLDHDRFSLRRRVGVMAFAILCDHSSSFSTALTDQCHVEHRYRVSTTRCLRYHELTRDLSQYRASPTP